MTTIIFLFAFTLLVVWVITQAIQLSKYQEVVESHRAEIVKLNEQIWELSKPPF